MRLPKQGLSPDQVRERLGRAGSHDVDWRNGRGWSLVYDSPTWHAELVDEAAAQFAHENALSHSAFPSAQAFESQVVSMAASVVAPGVRSYGVFTSGGTESLMVAVKAYRDHSAPGRDEMVLPSTAHPGFGKAADYLGLRVRLVPVAADGLPDPADVIAAMGEHTAMVGVSAPCFPYGVVDPIAPIAQAAAERGIGVHVDAAMGGLFLPFLSPDVLPGGEPVRFGLDVEGVTSVSVDLHKYGYGAKGASVLLFANNELRHAAYHVWTGWSGGAYAASGVLGTRSVGAAAAAWTAMSALGVAGYREMVAKVMATARQLQDGMTEQGLTVIGRPPMGVFALTSSHVPVPAVAAGMGDRGWWIDTQDPPPALHFVVFPRHAWVAADFLQDLGEVLAQSQDAPVQAAASSYGVMIRGGKLNDHMLREHLDRRFDAHHHDERRSND